VGKRDCDYWGAKVERADVSFWLSIMGFATSIILAIIKGIEFYNARHISISVDSGFTSDEGIGNTLTLLNRSSTPITISYYELAWVERRKLLGITVPFTQRVTYSETPLDPVDGCQIGMPPHATHSLAFTDEYHFDWGGCLKQAIYLKIWLVGRRAPIWRWITGPGPRRPR
jgi:hypothetical protein